MTTADETTNSTKNTTNKFKLIHMQVIPPTHKDINKIIELINQDKKHLLPRNHKEVAKKIHFWRIIKDGEDVVACGCFDAYSRRMAEIRSFIVRESHRGKGLARALLDDLMKMARPNQQVFVVTSIPEFFQKNRFDSCLGEKYIMFYKRQDSQTLQAQDSDQSA